MLPGMGGSLRASLLQYNGNSIGKIFVQISNNSWEAEPKDKDSCFGPFVICDKIITIIK